MYCSLTHLLHVGTADNECTACIPNPEVDSDLLERVHSWIRAGATTDDTIERLRLETVPVGYKFHTCTYPLLCIVSLPYTCARRQR